MSTHCRNKGGFPFVQKALGCRRRLRNAIGTQFQKPLDLGGEKLRTLTHEGKSTSLDRQYR
jgi:hypothetical protein